jgi:hypothetical protein
VPSAGNWVSFKLSFVRRGLLLEHSHVIGIVIDHNELRNTITHVCYADAECTVRCRIKVELGDKPARLRER